MFEASALNRLKRLRVCGGSASPKLLAADLLSRNQFAEIANNGLGLLQSIVEVEQNDR